jgi:hypothetical protein
MVSWLGSIAYYAIRVEAIFLKFLNASSYDEAFLQVLVQETARHFIRVKLFGRELVYSPSKQKPIS